MSGSSHSDECRCGVVDPADDDLAGLSGPPDFTVESTQKTHRIYWRSGDHVTEKFGPGAIGYAAVGGDYIVLNRDQTHFLSNDVLAHEIGHNLGYEHVDGSVMDATVFGMTDDRPGVPLHETSVEIFRAIDGVLLGEWTRSQVQQVVRAAVRSDLPRSAAVRAVTRYVRDEGPDALFRTNWGLDRFAPAGVLQAGEYY